MTTWVTVFDEALLFCNIFVNIKILFLFSSLSIEKAAIIKLCALHCAIY